MSYGFDMGFAQANSLQEAMTIALEYTQSQMTEKNIRKRHFFGCLFAADIFAETHRIFRRVQLRKPVQC